MTGRQRRLRVVIRWLALVCCCLGALAALPAAPAAAAPTLTLTPEGGPCGRDAVFSGAQFSPGDRVTLRGPREAATNNRLATYREPAVVVAADGRWAITTPFCAAGDGTWALADTEDQACLVPSPPCSEYLYEVASLPDPPPPHPAGSGFEKGVRVRITRAALPGLPNTGGGGLAGR